MSDDVARAFREAAAWSADHHPVLPTYATGYHAALDAIALAILSVDLADVTKELLAELAAHFTVLPVTDRFNAPDLSVGEHPRVLGDLLRVELRNDGAELWGIVALKEAFLRQLVGGELRPAPWPTDGLSLARDAAAWAAKYVPEAAFNPGLSPWLPLPGWRLAAALADAFEATGDAGAEEFGELALSMAHSRAEDLVRLFDALHACTGAVPEGRKALYGRWGEAARAVLCARQDTATLDRLARRVVTGWLSAPRGSHLRPAQGV